jgi:hypothetical protein
MIYHGSYVCVNCSKDYLVNEVDTWRLCTPELCHDCLAKSQKMEECNDNQDHQQRLQRSQKHCYG